MRALTLSLVCLSLALGGIARGEGVLIYKNQPFHPDNTAFAFRYDRIEGGGFVTWVVVGKERKRFEKTQFHVWVELPTTLPAELTSAQDAATIIAQRDEIQKISTRFPAAAPIAKQSLALHNEWCTKLQAGMIRHRGEWMTKADFVALQNKQAADEQALKELAERKHKEMVETEMARKLAKEREARQLQEDARMAIIDEKKAELRDLQDEIGTLEESTKRLVQDFKNLMENDQ